MTTALLWMFAGIGALATVLVLAAVAVFLWELLAEQKGTRANRQWHQIGQAYMRQRLVNDSWWFGEDEPTMNLLRRLGEGDGVDRVRTDWRHERAAAKVVTEP